MLLVVCEQCKPVVIQLLDLLTSKQYQHVPSCAALESRHGEEAEQDRPLVIQSGEEN
jgi:hypothetical protein